MKSRGGDSESEKWYLIPRSSFTVHVCPSSDMAPSEDAVSAWSCNQVAQWLQEEGFGDYVELLCTQHRLDGLSLLALTEADLRGPPLGLTVLGDIKRMTIALRRLQRQNQGQLEELGLGLADSLPAGLSVNTAEVDWSCDGADGRYTRGGRSCNSNGLRLRNGERPGYAPGASLCHMHSNGRCRQHLAGRLDPEVWKTVISSFYVFFVFGFTSFVMVIVHERVPDMRTYPPLPDIFLDRYRFLPASTCCVTVCRHSCLTHSSFCALTVFPEFLGRLQWLKRVASSCVTCFCWFCSFTNTGRATPPAFSITKHSISDLNFALNIICTVFHPEDDVWMFACVLGPSSSDGCVLWWELCFCFAAALCLSPLSLCLDNTSSVPVRWEPHMRLWANNSSVVPVFFLCCYLCSVTLFSMTQLSDCENGRTAASVWQSHSSDLLFADVWWYPRKDTEGISDLEWIWDDADRRPNVRRLHVQWTYCCHHNAQLFCNRMWVCKCFSHRNAWRWRVFVCLTTNLTKICTFMPTNPIINPLLVLGTQF